MMNLTDNSQLEEMKDQAEYYTFHITVPWIGFTLFVAFLPVVFIILIIIFYKFYTREDDERISRCSSGSSTLISALSTSSLKLRKDAILLFNKQPDPVLKRNSSYTSNHEGRYWGVSPESSVGQNSCGSESDEENRLCSNTCKSILHHHHGSCFRLHQHHVKFREEVGVHLKSNTEPLNGPET